MRPVIFLLLLMISSPSFCQIIFEPELTWEQAAKKAKAENKLVFIHLEGNKCQQCNEVASQGFNSGVLREKFAVNFISLRVNVETEAGKKLTEKFGIKGSLVSLFVDPQGNILHRYEGSTSAGFIYAEQADIALSRRGGKQLDQFIKEYEGGQRSLPFLKEYIVKRKQSSLSVEDFLDEYVTLLPADSLKNYNTIRYIYAQGPSLDSKAYKSIHAVAPKTLMDSIYRTVPFSEAVAMNNAIINTSFRKAVDKKDRELAYTVSGFSANSYMPDITKGMLAFNRSILRYFYFVKDTSRYFLETRRFLGQVHQRLTVDSLLEMDEKEFRNQPFPKETPSKEVSIQRVGFTAPSQFFHIELNEHAWHFYEMARKKEDLETALQWSQLSMAWFDELTKNKQHPMRLGNAAYLDTYAHILYKLERRNEAIEWQTKAVEAQKVTGHPTGSFEATLAKMKEGKL